MGARALGRMVVVLSLALGGFGAVAQPAPAQGPGGHGKVAFMRVVNGMGDVWIMKPDGSRQRNLTNTPYSDERGAALSPGGDVVVFVRDGALYKVAADGTQPPAPIPIAGEGAEASEPAWAPDGSRILFRGTRGDPTGDIFAVPASGGRLVNLTNTSTADESEPAESATGRIAFVSDRTGNPDLFVAAADGSSPQDVTNTPGGEATPRFSPDGQRIAYSALGTGGNPDVFVRTVSGGVPVNVTDDPASDTGPAFSPNGRKLVFSSTRGGHGAIYVARISPHAPATDLSGDAGGPQDDVSPDWAPPARTGRAAA